MEIQNVNILLNVDTKFEPKAKYAFRIMMRILGYNPVFFTKISSQEIHIYYGTRTTETYPLKIYRSIETALFFNQKNEYPSSKYNSVNYQKEYIPFLFSLKGEIFSISPKSVYFG